MSKKHTTGWLIKLLSFFARHVRLKHTRKQVVKNRGQHCGDVELTGYLTSDVVPVSLVLDLRITHDRVGNSVDPNLNGHLTIMITLLVLYHSYLLFLVRPGGYISTLSDFYSYKLIGKLNAFFQFQEFSFRNPPVEDSSTFSVRCSSRTSSQKSETYSLRLLLYVLILTYVDGILSCLNLTLTLHPRKLLVC